MRSSSYLLSLCLPMLGLYGLWFGGASLLLLPVAAFVAIPVVELFIDGRGSREDDLTGVHRLGHDLVLLLAFMIVWVAWCLLLYKLSTEVTSWASGLGHVLVAGILFGSFGINVAHELGHRREAAMVNLSQALLIPSFYMHFFIEHNRGHHRWMATPRDPATARKGETLYGFWARSVVGGWLNAWKIESHRLRGKGLRGRIVQNQMLQFQLLQTAFAVAVGVFFGAAALVGWVCAAIIGFLMLETVNYVEHYGMLRAVLPDGRYERVTARHSWTSDHPISRALLFELPRHADHHAHSGRPYGALRHFSDAPQLPTGYAGMLLLASVPPLFWRVMERQMEKEADRLAA